MKTTKKMNENTNNNLNYDRIATAISYIKENFKKQPNLSEIAEKVHLSPFHFQRIFTEWAGVSPKKFLQYISIEYAKNILKEPKSTLFDVAHETGLSGTGRLHDLFMNIEGMTPYEFKNSGENLSINYNFYESPFGEILVASTTKGICYMAFVDNQIDSQENNQEIAFKSLQNNFSKANFNEIKDVFQENVLAFFAQDFNTNFDINSDNNKNIPKIKLHLKGTDFQLKVWEMLLKIPLGELSTYGNIAEKINNPNATRAVGTAIGKNPVAFLIPCHRVIQASGMIGGYMWGTTRKTAIIGWEAAKRNF